MDYPRFPLFVDISGWKVLVAGGGTISERRVKTLLRFGAGITVVAPQVTAGLKELAAEEKINLVFEEFETVKIDKNKWNLVLAATGDKDLNHDIYSVCKANDILVNNASNQDECDFFFPAIMEGQGIVAGMTSGGKDHAKVKKIAAEIREILSRGDQ